MARVYLDEMQHAEQRVRDLIGRVKLEMLNQKIGQTEMAGYLHLEQSTFCKKLNEGRLQLSEWLVVIKKLGMRLEDYEV